MNSREQSSYQLLRCRSRGSWTDSDLQIYLTKDDEPCGNMGDWVYVGFKSSRQLLAQRLSQTESESLTSARVFDCQLTTTREFLTKNRTLKRLDISKTNLDSMPAGLIDPLTFLQRLNLSNNDITEKGLSCLSPMPNLIEINLTSNLLSAFPTSLNDMAPKLSRLYIGYNDIESLAGVETLPNLTLLDAECNLIKYVNWASLTECCRLLQVLRLQFNKIEYVEKKVKQMRDLREFNLSHNSLSQVPIELFSLPHLECLDLSHNVIPRVETVHVTMQSSRMAGLVDLSNNQLTRMPEFLLLLTSKLDLSSNCITQIPGTILRHMDYNTEQQLDVKDNPIKTPPYDVCEAGISSMIKYFQRLKISTPNYHGMKVVVLGNKGVGKTSLVRNIVEDHPLIAACEEETIFCDISEVVHDVGSVDGPSKPLSISIWDFSGDSRYQHIMQHFVDPEALVLLTFNLATYRTAEFYTNFGRWLDYILAKSNQIKLIPVGTHADLLNETTIRKISAEVGSKIVSFVEQRKAELQEKMHRIERLPEISSYLQSQLKHVSGILANVAINMPLHGKATPVSSKTGSGVRKLMADIAGMVEKKRKLFPRVLSVIPTLWNEVADTVSSIGRLHSIPMMTWDKFQEELTERHGLKNVMTDVAQHLHEAGKIFWVHQHKGLRNFVILRPLWIVAIMKNLVGHGTNPDGFAELEDSCLRRGVTKPRFAKYVEEFCEQGCVDGEFLHSLWTKECPLNNSETGLLVAMLSSAFEYAYTIERSNPKVKDSPFSLKRTQHGMENVSESSTAKQKAGPASVVSTTAAPAKIRSRTSSNRKSKDNQTETLSERSESRASSTTISSRTTRKSNFELRDTHFPSLLVPSLRDLPEMLFVREELSAMDQRSAVGVGYRFPMYAPPDLFDRVAVRLSQNKFGLYYLALWRNGLYAKSEERKLRLHMQMVAGDGADDRLQGELRIKLVNLDDVSPKPMQDLWKSLLAILNDCEELFNEYAGLCLDRYAQCPLCMNDSFRGEWSSPKDMQALPTRRCSGCKEEISTEFIIQPLERKAEDVQRVFIELDKRRKEQQARCTQNPSSDAIAGAVFSESDASDASDQANGEHMEDIVNA